MRWGLLALVLIAAGVPTAARPQTPDACAQASVDWPSVERSGSLPVLTAYRDVLPPACTVHRALADARMRELGARMPNTGRTGRARVSYHCESGEDLQVLFDYNKRTATLFRYARPTVHMQQTDRPNGFRYRRSDAYYIEGADKALTVVAPSGAQFCRAN